MNTGAFWTRGLILGFFVVLPSLSRGLEKPPDTIVIESGHVVLQPGSEGLGVLEVLNVENRGPLYEGISMGPQAKISLRFPVPQGAQDLAPSPESGPGFMSVGMALAYVQPLAPGKKSVVFSYRIPWAGGGASFKRLYRYKVEHLSLMAEEGTLKFDVEGAKPSDPLDLQGRTFKQFHVMNLAADQELTIKAKPEGRPDRGPAAGAEPMGSAASTDSASSSSGSLPSPAMMMGMLSLALVMAFLGYILGFARGRAVGAEKPDPEALKRSLVAEMAVLDDRHDQGSLPDAEWKKKRAELKNRLLALMEESAS